jgi:preprotein translocase subunit SecE
MKKIIAYFKEVYNELVNKVSWPSWKELQTSALIVMIASLLIALIVFVMDYASQNLMGFIYGLFY